MVFFHTQISKYSMFYFYKNENGRNNKSPVEYTKMEYDRADCEFSWDYFWDVAVDYLYSIGLNWLNAGRFLAQSGKK